MGNPGVSFRFGLVFSPTTSRDHSCGRVGVGGVGLRLVVGGGYPRAAADDHDLVEADAISAATGCPDQEVMTIARTPTACADVPPLLTAGLVPRALLAPVAASRGRGGGRGRRHHGRLRRGHDRGRHDRLVVDDDVPLAVAVGGDTVAVVVVGLL